MTNLAIVPECFVDTRIAELLAECKSLNHQHGCGNVSRILQTKLKDSIALGIIDEDKNKTSPKYFDEFYTVERQNSLLLKKHGKNKHFLIIVCPEIENWLLMEAQSVGIRPESERFGLPSNMQGFIKVSKLSDIYKNDGFKVFIRDLLKAEAPGISTMKKWIDQFINKELN